MRICRRTRLFHHAPKADSGRNPAPDPLWTSGPREPLEVERFPAQMSQIDVGHSMRRVVEALSDQSAAYQPLILHQEQVFENIPGFGKMFQIIVMQRQHALI